MYKIFLQDSSGQVLDKWTIASREEEHVILQQFLRFGETKSIAQEIILQDTKEHDIFFKSGNRSDSEIKKFIERNNHSMQSYMRSFESRHLFGSRIPFVPMDSRLLSPASLSNFSPPSSRELRPAVVTAGMTSSSPSSGSPLGRLQTMQPFDYRREQGSPALSPVIPDKRSGSSPSLSPKNLSSTPPSSQPVTPPFTPIKGLENQDQSPMSLTKIPMTLPILPPKDNQAISAIDYSTKDSPVSPNSIFSDRKLKHIRKSNNPVKRQWNPSPGFGTTLIGPNGKKRVLCTACNKTFCDKGALKIHYSAVHLKEMHKCTVDGCNMMFSSRRSRNRHSANPNPKLHMPQKRVKMSESNSSLNDDSDKSLACSPPPTMVMPPTLGPHGTIPPIDGKDIHPASQAAFYAELNAHLSMFPTPEKRYKLFHNDEGPKDFSMLHNRDSKLESDGESMSDKEDRQKMVSPTQRASRRKNNIPTRYKQPTENYSDDNSDEKDSPKECIDDGRYYHRRSKIADSIENERSSSPQSQRYYLNLSLAEGDASDKKEDDESPSRRDFPKIVSLLSKSPGYDSQEALDFSKPKKKVEEESEMEIDLNATENKETDIDKSDDDFEEKGDLEESFVCDRCEKTFSNDASLQYHIKTIHKSTKTNKTTSEFSSRKRKISRTEDESEGKMEERESKRKEDEENHQPIKCNGTQSNGNGLLQEIEDAGKDNEEEDRDSGTELNEICLEENEISVDCHICESKFKDNLALKEHFEVNHPKEMFNCTVKGCEKIFSTRKSRNRHSQNDNLHRHLCSENQNRVV